MKVASVNFFAHHMNKGTQQTILTIKEVDGRVYVRCYHFDWPCIMSRMRMMSELFRCFGVIMN